MNNTKQEEINLLDLQNITTIIYILSLIVSIYITSVDRDSIANPNKKHTNTVTISKLNRILVIILTLSYFYISYENRKIAIKKGQKPDLFNLQVMSSEISILSSLIVTYVVFKSLGENYTIISGIENPNL